MGEFVLGLDLDGVCADFYGKMRKVVAEWRDVKVKTLPKEVSFGLPQWGIYGDEYLKIHRFAVTERKLFTSMKPVPGAAQALRRLSTEGIRIRVITHRLFIDYFHEEAVSQTVRWLDRHAIPYSDLCFMKEKGLVEANIYVEDSPENIISLERTGRDVITLTNSTNRGASCKQRAANWKVAESMILAAYHNWESATS